MDSSSVDKSTFHVLSFDLADCRLIREFEENSYNYVIAEPDELIGAPWILPPPNLDLAHGGFMCAAFVLLGNPRGVLAAMFSFQGKTI